MIINIIKCIAPDVSHRQIVNCLLLLVTNNHICDKFIPVGELPPPPTVTEEETEKGKVPTATEEETDKGKVPPATDEETSNKESEYSGISKFRQILL